MKKLKQFIREFGEPPKGSVHKGEKEMSGKFTPIDDKKAIDIGHEYMYGFSGMGMSGDKDTKKDWDENLKSKEYVEDAKHLGHTIHKHHDWKHEDISNHGNLAGETHISNSNDMCDPASSDWEAKALDKSSKDTNQHKDVIKKAYKMYGRTNYDSDPYL